MSDPDLHTQLLEARAKISEGWQILDAIAGRCPEPVYSALVGPFGMKTDLQEVVRKLGNAALIVDRP